MKSRILTTVLTLALAIIGSAFAGVSTTYATPQGLQVSPPRVELNVKRGQPPYIVDINVMNVTSSTLSYQPVIEDFRAVDETGTPGLMIDESLDETSSLRYWIQDMDAFTLKPKESRDLKVVVNVPDDAQPGGHYGAIVFNGTEPAVESNGVGVSANTGVILLVRVDGAVDEDATLASFFASKDGNQSSFFEYGPVDLSTRIENSGSVHVKPFGTITVKDMFGNTVKTIDFNDEGSNVLPNSIRRFDDGYDGGFMFGLYTADLALGYGTKGHTIIGSTSFWVIPYRLILAILLALMTLLYVIYRMIKLYNKRIEQKVMRRYEKKGKH